MKKKLYRNMLVGIAEEQLIKEFRKSGVFGDISKESTKMSEGVRQDLNISMAIQTLKKLYLQHRPMTDWLRLLLESSF